MGKPDIAYALSSDASLEQARDVRARAWRYVFDCHAKKKAGATHYAGDEAKGPDEHDRPAPPILPR